MRFNADGTSEWWSRDSKFDWTNRGTYKLAGDIVAMTLSGATVNPGQIKEDSQKGHVFNLTLQWITSDKIQLSRPGESPHSFTRRLK